MKREPAPGAKFAESNNPKGEKGIRMKCLFP
jgi:hypothetical protein